MPGRDRSGPMGRGSMTGRGKGYCAGNSAWDEAAMGGIGRPGLGYGRGAGAWDRPSLEGGRIRRRWFQSLNWPRFMRFGRGAVYSQGAAPSEKEALEQEAVMLKTQLSSIQKRLDELAPEVEAD